MIERLELDDILGINAEMCADTGENSVCLDVPGLEAAVDRPWSGFGEEQFFPTLFDKAAALMHGIASRQVFENGNKRTAWAAAAAFLDINGIDIGMVEPVQSDMFVRAAALDHTLEIRDLSEWFEVAYARRRVGHASDPRLEYLALASMAVLDPDGSQGLVDVAHMHLTTLAPPAYPMPIELCILTRIHWRTADLGHSHQLTLKLDQDQRVAAPVGKNWTLQLDPPTVGGHSHQAGGIMPAIVAQHFNISLIRPGFTWITASIDGAEVGRLPLQLIEPFVPSATLWDPRRF